MVSELVQPDVNGSKAASNFHPKHHGVNSQEQL